MDRLLLHRLRTLVAFEIGTFQKHLRTLKSLHFPSQAGPRLIDALEKESKRQQNEIEQLLADFADDSERSARVLRSQHRLLVQKLGYLSSLENAQTVAVPWSLVPSLERLASALLPDKTLLTACTYSLNYGIRWCPAPRSSVQKFAILELPAIHKANAFLHIVAGHELFHPILQDFFQSQTPGVMRRLKGLASQAVQKWRLDELVEHVRYIWQRALEELMCDMGCAALFGPSAVFASSMIHIASDLDEPPSAEGSFYPPPRYRLRAVLRYALDALENNHPETDRRATRCNGGPIAVLARVLEDRGCSWAADLLQDHIASLKNAVGTETDLQGIDADPLLKMAYEEVQKSLPQAWEYVRQRATAMQAFWLDSIDDVPKLLKTIGLLVPPGEIREETRDAGAPLKIRPPSLSAICLAMWLHRLKEEAQPDDDGDLNAYHRLCRLMLKAFEDVELRLAYDSRKKTLGMADNDAVPIEP